MSVFGAVASFTRLIADMMPIALRPVAAMIEFIRELAYEVSAFFALIDPLVLYPVAAEYPSPDRGFVLAVQEQMNLIRAAAGD